MNFFTLFYKVVDWFGAHVLTIKILNVSLLGWLVGILMATVIVTFVLTFKPQGIRLSPRSVNVKRDKEK